MIFLLNFHSQFDSETAFSARQPHDDFVSPPAMRMDYGVREWLYCTGGGVHRGTSHSQGPRRCDMLGAVSHDTDVCKYGIEGIQLTWLGNDTRPLRII
jgi:hypothetical protein